MRTVLILAAAYAFALAFAWSLARAAARGDRQMARPVDELERLYAEPDRMTDQGTAINDSPQEAAMRRVRLHYDADGEWTYIDHTPEPADDEADDEDDQFVVTVPEVLVGELQAAELANTRARSAIFDVAGFDPELGQFTEVCEAWIGDEPSPRRPFWDVVYQESGSPDEWPAGGYPARMTSFDTEEEAVAAIAAMPEEFLIHHHGLKLQLLRRDRLKVQHHPGWGGYRSRCHRCGHDYSEHPSEGTPS